MIEEIKMGRGNYFSTICKTKWHKSGTFFKLL